MRKVLKKLAQHQEGNALVLVAIMMVVLIGFAAIAIDAGRLYFEKSNLQKDLDAAVLAGAQDIVISESQAVATAIEVAGKNGIVLTADDIVTGSNFIEIKKTTNEDLTFARVLGFDNSDVFALARAEIDGALVSREGVVPIGILDTEYQDGVAYAMHFQPGNSDNASISGNFGFLDIEDPDNNNLRDAIINGTEMEISEEDDVGYELTKTGLSWGQVQDGFEWRIQQDEDTPSCNSFDTADSSCYRTIFVPMVETYVDANGKTLVKITGFASFWIDEVTTSGGDKLVTGRFIESVTYGEFRELLDENDEDYGVKRVRLVK